MTRTTEVFDLTHTLFEAANANDTEKANETITKIQQYLDDNGVEDEAYHNIVDRVEESITILEQNELTRDEWVQINEVACQIDVFYLRHDRERDLSQQPIAELRNDCNTFRMKAIEYAATVDRLIGVVEELHQTVKNQSETLDEYNSVLEDAKQAHQNQPDRTLDESLIDRLREAKDKIDDGESQQAEDIVGDIREKVATGDYQLKGYPKRLLLTRLKIAKVDAGLGRPTVLEDILTEVSDESNQNT